MLIHPQPFGKSETSVYGRRPTKSKGIQNVEGKGFAKQILPFIHMKDKLTQTEPLGCRKAEGRYLRIITQHTAIFRQMSDRYEVDNSVKILDIYARRPEKNQFWLIGKLSHESKYHAIDAIKSLEVLLVEYARTLLPNDLTGITYPEIWYAPGYTDLLAAKESQQLYKYYHFNREAKYINIDQIGFFPEIHEGGDAGFSIVRDEDGNPIRDNFSTIDSDSTIMNDSKPKRRITLKGYSKIRNKIKSVSSKN